MEKLLIEEGITLIDTEGFQNFSLRKLAVRCGVSHAAPYNHFPDKEALLQAIQTYIEDQFSADLGDCLKTHQEDEDRTIFLAQAYLNFFLERPHYFRFFMFNSGIQVDLSRLNSANGYRPFEIFKNAVKEELSHYTIPKSLRNQTILAMWAMVHGITGMATMNGVHYKGDWSRLLASILKQNMKLGEKSL